MLDIYRARNFVSLGKHSSKKAIAFVFGSLVTLASMTSCAHISVQPSAKDEELKGIEQFARTVTIHLVDTAPKSYQKYQALLVDEVVPGVFTQLKNKGICAKSDAEAKSRAQSMTKAKRDCQVDVEQADFPSRATADGLIPVEVSGTLTALKGGVKEKTSKFHLVYLVGTSPKTHKPIVASITFK